MTKTLQVDMQSTQKYPYKNAECLRYINISIQKAIDEPGTRFNIRQDSRFLTTLKSKHYVLLYILAPHIT